MADIEIKRRILTAYIASSVICLTANKICYTNRHRKYLVEAARELKYRDDLSARSCVALRHVIRFNKGVARASNVLSLVPIVNILYTARNMAIPDEALKEFYEERIAEINDIEVETRQSFLEQVKKFEYIPEEIQERLDDKDYLPSELEYREVMMANMPKTGFGLILSLKPMMPDKKRRYWKF